MRLVELVCLTVLERPEDVYDPRSLFERLQEQKNMKEEEWQQAHSLSLFALAARHHSPLPSSHNTTENQVYMGLDEDEFEFIDKVGRQQHEADQQRWLQEALEIKKFRISIHSCSLLLLL